MQRRHFLVKADDNGTYSLREIDPVIADAISFFGINTGQCYHAVESNHWSFYFMNLNISETKANQIASHLIKDFTVDHC